MKIFYILILLIFPFSLSAQSPFPFGQISNEDMEMTEYQQDKDAPAVYLFDWCSARIDVNEALTLTVERHFRIKILKPEGLDQAKISVYTGRKSILSKFKASTFNSEDGKTTEIPLNKKEIYYERNGNTFKARFAFSNVKVGSIIECTYTTNFESYFFFYPWEFQQDIPVIYDEYNAYYPALFRYKIDEHYRNVPVNISNDSESLRIGNIMTSLLHLKWAAVDVPAFKREPFIASESDLVSKVEFELAGIDLPNTGYDTSTPTYEKFSEELLEDENFGRILKKAPYLSKIVNDVTTGLTSDLDKVKAIHEYITKNIKWNEEMGIYASRTNFRKVLKEQTGSIGDINLLFVAMIQAADITSCPVILSTRENGSLNPFYAIKTKFDYVIAYADIDKKEYLMDATDNMRPFNELPEQCLNGNGRTIHPRMKKWIALNNNEQQYDQVVINADLGTDNELICNVQQYCGSYSAYGLRKLIEFTGKEGYIDILKHTGSGDFSDIEILNLDSINKSLIINYKVKIKGAIQNTPELCIINPVLLFDKSENPLSASERKFPVDFGFPKNELYTIYINIPDQLEIEEVPADANIVMNKKNGTFNYASKTEKNKVTLQYRFNRKGTYFQVEEYEELKEFYNQFLKKQSDLVILKKKKTTVANN